MTPFALTIVIPCYNEYERLPASTFRSFLANTPEVSICFVNDASTDNTLELLETLREHLTAQVQVLSNAKNLGKAGSVRAGMLFCSKSNQAQNYAFLDADLATSLEECAFLVQNLNSNISFVFASRILKIGSVIERKFSRFLSGRIIATFISTILDIKVYDTQCGCKVFKSSLIEILFKDEFISKWLFDVELFSRMLCYYGKEVALSQMEEIPVKQWIDQGDSKVKFSYFFRLWYDLFLIRKVHRRGMKSLK